MIPAELTWLQRRAPPNGALLTEAFRGETHYLPRLKDEGEIERGCLSSSQATPA